MDTLFIESDHHSLLQYVKWRYNQLLFLNFSLVLSHILNQAPLPPEYTRLMSIS